MKIIRLLLHLHPRVWRARYEEEILTVFEEHTITLATFLDLFLGLIDAWLDPHYKSEKSLFSPQRSVLTAITFVTLLSISTALLLIWQEFSSLGPYSGGIASMSYDFVIYSLYAEFVLLLFANLLFVVRLLRTTPPTEKKRTIFFALACLLLPLFVFQPAYEGLKIATTLFTEVGPLLSGLFTFITLEIAGCGFFIGLMKAKLALKNRQEGLVVLAVAVILLPALAFFVSKFFGGSMVPGWLVPPASQYNRFQAFMNDFGSTLLLFVGFGALLLAAGVDELHPYLRRVLRYASVLTTLIVVPLLTTIIYNLSMWISLWGKPYASSFLAFNWIPSGNLLEKYGLQLFFSLTLFTLILIASIGVTLVRGYRSLSTSTDSIQNGEQSTSEMMQMQQTSH
jgi:hypothetical protein